MGPLFSSLFDEYCTYLEVLGLGAAIPKGFANLLAVPRAVDEHLIDDLAAALKHERVAIRLAHASGRSFGGGYPEVVRVGTLLVLALAIRVKAHERGGYVRRRGTHVASKVHAVLLELVGDVHETAPPLAAVGAIPFHRRAAVSRSARDVLGQAAQRVLRRAVEDEADGAALGAVIDDQDHGLLEVRLARLERVRARDEKHAALGAVAERMRPKPGARPGRRLSLARHQARAEAAPIDAADVRYDVVRVALAEGLPVLPR